MSNNNLQCTFSIPASHDEILDSIPDDLASKLQYQPYWAEHWPSAEVFFQFLTTCENIKTGSTIIELGCGLGSLSTTLSLQGHKAYSIDISLNACLFTIANMHRNHATPRVICADFCNLPIKCPSDLIIASDILYEPPMVNIILQFIEKNLTKSNRLWIADPNRRWWQDFKKELEEREYKTKILHKAIAPDTNITVEILEIHL
jgi:predicted nicotinamide N-methyase